MRTHDCDETHLPISSKRDVQLLQKGGKVGSREAPNSFATTKEMLTQPFLFLLHLGQLEQM